MGISSTTNRVAYLGDGSSATFPFAYYFDGQADLKVFLYGSSVGSITQQTINTNYTISGTANSEGVYSQGGSVIFTSAVPSTHMVVITRSPSQIQDYTLVQGGQINSKAVVNQFDYMTLLIQRLQDQATRAVGLYDGQGSAFDTKIPPQGLAAGSVIMTNSSATGFAVGPTGDQVATAQSSAIQALASAVAANLSAANAAISDASAQSSALSATNNAILAGSAALSASISASIVGSSAFWGSTAQSAAVSATNQAVLSGSGALSASNSAALAASGALSATNQAVLSASGALSATNQAILAAASAGSITLPLPVASGGTGTQGAVPFAVAVWQGSSAIGTAGPTVAGYLLGAGPSNTPNWAPLNTHQNLLVNSAFDHWQNFANGSSVANGGQRYFTDQWYVNNFCGTSAVVTCSRVAPRVSGSLNACQVQVTTAPTAGQANGLELWQPLDNQTTLANFAGVTSGAFLGRVRGLGVVTQVGIQVFESASEAKIIGQTGSSLSSEVLVNVNSAAFTNTFSALTFGSGFTAGSSGIAAMRVRIVSVSSGSTHALNNGFVLEQMFMSTNVGGVAVQPLYARRYITPDAEFAACRRYLFSLNEPTYQWPVTSSAASSMFTWGTGNVTLAAGWTAGGYLPFPTLMRAVPTISYADAVGTQTRFSYWVTNGSRVDGYNPANPFTATRAGAQVQVNAAQSSNFIGCQVFFDATI